MIFFFFLYELSNNWLWELAKEKAIYFLVCLYDKQ